MKKQLLLLSTVALLWACGNGTSSSSQSSSGSSIGASSSVSESLSESSLSESLSSESSTSESSLSESLSSESSFSESSSSESVEVKPSQVALESLSESFEVKTTYVKQYSTGTPSNTYVRSLLGHGVLKAEIYSDSDFTKLSSQVQYENGIDDAADIVSILIDGSVNHTRLQLVDPIVNEDADALWSTSGLSNAFVNFAEEDFSFDAETKALNLLIDADKKQDPDFTYKLSNLATNLYPKIDGVSTHYFIQSEVESFKMILDDYNKPLSYELKFVDVEQSDGWGGTEIVKTSLNGTFVTLGEDTQIKQLTPFSNNDVDFDNAMLRLQAQNYNASYKRSYEDELSWPSSGNDYEGTLTSDGQGSLEISKVKPSATFVGYKQISDTQYRTYSLSEDVYTFTGDAKDGVLDNGVILPSFKICSAFFEKDVELSKDGTLVYNFTPGDKLVKLPSVESFCGFDGAISTLNQMQQCSVTITAETITFYNISGIYTTEIIYSNIGSVAAINRTIN